MQGEFVKNVCTIIEEAGINPGLIGLKITETVMTESFGSNKNKLLKSLAQWNKFDCIGHFDLVKRYASNFHTKANFMDYKERLEEILKILIQNGKGIEINTSALRYLIQ